MRVLIACEFSGVVREAFRRRGHDAWSCDLLPAADASPHHIQDDLRGDWFYWSGWDLMIAHPPCTYLSRAGARWWKDEGRLQKMQEAARFVYRLRDNALIDRICIENPIGKLNQWWRYPDQTIQPYQFGHPYSKATCLWLKNLPPLRPTAVLDEYKPLIRANVTARIRKGEANPGTYSGGIKTAITFQGIADAMAEQWSPLEGHDENKEK